MTGRRELLGLRSGCAWDERAWNNRDAHRRAGNRSMDVNVGASRKWPLGRHSSAFIMTGEQPGSSLRASRSATAYSSPLYSFCIKIAAALSGYVLHTHATRVARTQQVVYAFSTTHIALVGGWRKTLYFALRLARRNVPRVLVTEYTY